MLMLFDGIEFYLPRQAAVYLNLLLFLCTFTFQYVLIVFHCLHLAFFVDHIGVASRFRLPIGYRIYKNLKMQLSSSLFLSKLKRKMIL